MQFAELHDLFHHMPLLIDLDGIHRGVSPGVFKLTHRGAEPFAERLDP